MARSMTGFGKATRQFNQDAITVELNAVNHRYLDCGVRLPSSWSALEYEIRQRVKARAARGKINVTVSRKRGESSGARVRFDVELARDYVDAARGLGRLMGSDQPLSVDVLARLDGVFSLEEPEEDLEGAKEVVTDAVEDALTMMIAMREKEGKALAEEVAGRAGEIRATLEHIEAHLPEVNALYEQRLRTRIEELRLEPAVAEDRVAMEVAVMAEKGDVTEELLRLRTHLDHAIDLLELGEPVGRRLDFIAQEIHREINTLGVKVRDSDVAKEVFVLKAELDRIREQVQNIE